MPSQFAELLFVGSIASSVTFNFLFPKCAVGLRHAEFRAMFMPVPEAAMDEDHGAVFGQHDVGPAGQAAIFLAIHREAVAKPMEHRAHRKLRLGVAAADARHHLRALFWSEDIGHSWRASRKLRSPQTLAQEWRSIMTNGSIWCANHSLFDCPHNQILPCSFHHEWRQSQPSQHRHSL